VPVFAFFGLVDLTFLSANLLKILEGGVPDRRRALVFRGDGTWWRGRRILAEQRARDAMPLGQFVETLNPIALCGCRARDLHDRDLSQFRSAAACLKHYKALHERVVMNAGRDRGRAARGPR